MTDFLTQVLDFANDNEDIRVVMMNGSRVNKNAPKDSLQDYDIVFFVDDYDLLKYKHDKSWITKFGEVVVIQQNDFDEGFITMIQYLDERLDLQIRDIKNVLLDVQEDSLTEILINKDQINLEVNKANDSDYYTKQPTHEEFSKLINEIWWIQTYVVKGIVRDELPYVKYMYDVILMDAIVRLISIYVGTNHNFKVNVGKCGKWLKNYLSKEEYDTFTSLYASTNYREIFSSLKRLGEFVDEVTTSISKHLDFSYNQEEADKVKIYIEKMKITNKFY